MKTTVNSFSFGLLAGILDCLQFLYNGFVNSLRTTLIYKPSPLVDDLRNAIGNVVFSKGASGNYVRKRTSPSQPYSAYASAVKARLADISKAWMNLTASQIAGWNLLASGVFTTNSLGGKSSFTGIALFQQINNNLVNVGEDMLTDAPTLEGVDLIEIVSLTAVKSTGVITFTLGDALDAGMKAKIFAAPMVPVSRQLVKSELRQIYVADSTDTAAIALKNAYGDRYPAGLNTGDQLFVAIELVNVNTGESGQRILTACTVA
jgi:hypothetical protein